MSSGLRTSVEGGTVTATACSSHFRAGTSAIDKICRSSQCSSMTAISLEPTSLPRSTGVQRLPSFDFNRRSSAS